MSAFALYGEKLVMIYDKEMLLIAQKKSSYSMLILACPSKLSEHVRYYTERVLNVRSDQKNKERVQKGFVSFLRATAYN